MDERLTWCLGIGVAYVAAALFGVVIALTGRLDKPDPTDQLTAPTSAAHAQRMVAPYSSGADVAVVDPAGTAWGSTVLAELPGAGEDLCLSATDTGVRAYRPTVPEGSVCKIANELQWWRLAEDGTWELIEAPSDRGPS